MYFASVRRRTRTYSVRTNGVGAVRAIEVESSVGDRYIKSAFI